MLAKTARSAARQLVCLPIAMLAILLTTINVEIAHAQFGEGAVIVTVPSTDSNVAPAKPLARPPKASSQPKRQRKASVRRPRPRRTRPRRAGAEKLKIAVLVNDSPITEYEIGQRASLLAARSGIRKKASATFKKLISRPSTNKRLRAILDKTIRANQGRSRKQILAIFERQKKQYALSVQRQAMAIARKSAIPGLRKKATQELIEERLKLQAAKQFQVLVSDAQLTKVMQGIAKRNKLSFANFKKQLARQGTDYKTMRTRIRSQMSWGRLINAKFGRFVDVNQKTIDESVIAGNDATKVSIHLHRFIFKLPNKITQRDIAQRMVEADAMRARFNGCTSSRKLVVGHKGVAFKDMGFQVAAAVAEPTRSHLLNLGDGKMAPAITTKDGVALFAICGRRSGTKSFAARAAAVNTLRQKHTRIYGRKYLSDLRREAHIEYRTQ
ncbi:MAG: peptidyl-prolyl cis-trans isomerase SurA [Alphaproteobacteria bacterium]|jgi:peptidyl-prolyl cis-trans isomerase SurA